VFYLHSRLLERAAKLNKAHGGGSLTALPVIETQANDVSAFIPTNVISITDGQIYLQSDLFNAGQRPALNVGISVSRVGGDAQTKAMRQVAGQLRLDLAQYRELAAFAQFASDLDTQTRNQLERGARLTELLKQDKYQPIPLAEQVAVLYAGTQGHVDKVPVARVKEWEAAFVRFMRSEQAGVLEAIEKQKALDDPLIERLKAAISTFNHQFGVEESVVAKAAPKGEPKAEVATAAPPKPTPPAEVATAATPKPKPPAEVATAATPKPKPPAEVATAATPEPKPRAEVATPATPETKPKAETATAAPPEPKPNAASRKPRAK